MFRQCPFVLLSWQLMPGSDILRGSGDSFGDTSVCDPMTSLCLYLILERMLPGAAGSCQWKAAPSAFARPGAQALGPVSKAQKSKPKSSAES